jgi:hypothetical protein
MEGSRHEKAIITVAAYVIGFTTAFVLFSNVSTKVEKTFTYVPQVNTASVIQAKKAIEEPEKVEGVFVTYTLGKLMINVNSVENLLSYNPAVSDISEKPAELTQGFHYGDIVYKVDQTDSFVFFCEIHEPEAENCHGYIYDIKADRIYPVIKDGNPVEITPKSANQAIWTAVGLKIASNYSANPTAPWVLIDADSKLDLE